VQRWERTQGLPVHRHRHSRLSTAYAHRSELDAWWHNRSAQPGDDLEAPAIADDENGTPAAREAIGSSRLRILAFCVSLVVVSIGWFVWQARDVRASLPLIGLTGEPWVLVAAVDNQTGEPVWSGTLDYALRQQLSLSSVVRVASTDRVRDALQLMRRPLDTTVNAAIGREISVRDGAIRLLVATRLDKVAGRYSLSLDLIAPNDGRIVATDRRSVDRPDRVLDALSEQAAWVRRTLGERWPEMQTPSRAERVTTSSLEALQLYTSANELGLQFKWAAALKLLQAAVERDPEFASAHILLAHAMANTGQPWPDVLRESGRARELASAVSEVERYFIEGSHLTFEANAPPASPARERLAAAAAAYEALLKLEPNHYWATNNLMFMHERLGRVDLAAPLAVKHAGGRPNDVLAQVLAARALTAWRGDPEGARPFVERARELVGAGVPLQAPFGGWLDLFDAHVAWANGDAPRARHLVDHQAARLPELSGDLLNSYSHQVGAMYLALGRCRDARAAIERMSGDQRHEALALAALHCDDRQAFVSHMLADVRPDDLPSYQRVMWGPRTGRVADAAGWIRDFRRRFSNPLTIEVAEGELAAARRDWTTAAHHLEAAWSALRLRGQERTPMIAERLADVQIQAGRPARALEVLEATVPLRAKMYEVSGLPGGMAWIRAQVTLARMYRTLGRSADAASREAEIRSLLTEADPDLPLMARVR